MGRRERRRHRDEQLRHLRALYRELTDLRARRKSYPVVPVEKPYQSGWSRTYVLREDVNRRKDAPVIRRILDKLNSVVYSSRKDFLVRNWHRRQGESEWKPISQPLKTLNEAQFEQLNDKERSLFHQYWEWSQFSRKMFIRFRFRYPYYFVFKITPRWITHQVIPLNEVESRIQEIENYLQKHDLWRVLDHEVFYNPRRSDWYLEAEAKKNRRSLESAQKEIAEFLDGPTEQEIIEEILLVEEDYDPLYDEYLNYKYPTWYEDWW